VDSLSTTLSVGRPGEQDSSYEGQDKPERMSSHVLGRLLVTHFGANASCGLTIDLGLVALDVGTTASQGFLRAIKVLAAAHQRLAGPLQLFVGAALDRGNLPVHAARPSIESTFLLVHTRFAFVEAPLPLVGNLFAAISGLLPVVSQTVALVGDRVATISSFTPLPRTPTPARPRAPLGAASTCPGRSIPSTVAPACAQVDGQSEECLAMSTRLGPGATGQREADVTAVWGRRASTSRPCTSIRHSRQDASRTPGDRWPQRSQHPMTDWLHDYPSEPMVDG
jgi:hypothetical protein